MTTDPIADLLNRIRNGILSRQASVELPSSKLKVRLAEILRDEGYLGPVSVAPDEKQGRLTIDLKWTTERQNVIAGLRRVSKPGRRVYTKVGALPTVRGGLGIAVVSTPKGVMTADAAKTAGVGGEVLCEVW
jgi:small subunit ribosomal protein S8